LRLLVKLVVMLLLLLLELLLMLLLSRWMRHDVEKERLKMWRVGRQWGQWRRHRKVGTRGHPVHVLRHFVGNVRRAILPRHVQ